MTGPGIEPRSPGPLANTLPAYKPPKKSEYKNIFLFFPSTLNSFYSFDRQKEDNGWMG